MSVWILLIRKSLGGSPAGIHSNRFGMGFSPLKSVGLLPIKLNAVVVRGYNDDQVIDLAALTLTRNWQVRFIEMMPFGGTTDLQTHQVVTTDQMIDHIESEFGKLERGNDGKLDGEAMFPKSPMLRAIWHLYPR